MNLLQQLQRLFHEALTGIVSDPAPYAVMVKPAQDARFGDYQANCAMSLAKTLGQKPREVAERIVSALDLSDMLEKPEVAGPGFINLRLRDDWLTRQVRKMAADDRLGIEPPEKPRTYVIDYSSPNVAKPLHVGHLRSTIIGDALARLLRFLGHRVITDNHLGDWGTQFGILLYGYKNMLDREAYQRDPVRELARLYIEVRRQFQQDEEDEAGNDPIQEACRRETAELHAGDPENVALWKEFMPPCLEEIDQIYRRLGILPFDHLHGESFYNPMLPGVVEDLLAKSLAVESDGAIVIPNARGIIPTTDEERKTEEPPGLIRKRDRAFTYTTSDLATIRYRMEHFHPDTILYVVDFRQALHFKTLFAQARRWGYDNVELGHISFGSVLGKPENPGDKPRPISTRAGGGALLEDLLSMAIQAAAVVHQRLTQEARERGEEVPTFSPEELRQLHEAVGIGAVKYADLSQNRTSDYVFDLDKMTSTEGNTATYMQYAYVRNRGIFRKYNVDIQALRQSPPPVLLTKSEERGLALQLLRFHETLDATAGDYKPNLITAYLWELASTYSVFYERCPIFKEPTPPPEVQQSRLLLCDLTARVIQRGLDLLGIRTAERM
jgi:arginyl-tRNA synthetase